MNSEDLQSISGKRMLLQIDHAHLTALDWAERNKNELDQYLSVNGALLVRGLQLNDEEFGRILTTLFSEELASYTYRSTPRTAVGNNVYTATEYHPSETIPQHNENSYASSWPLRIAFLCVTPATYRGNTPISDSRVAYQHIPTEIREEFERKKVMYVRNYSSIDLPWSEVFQTKDKAVVESFCNSHGIEFEWTDDGLRTRQVCQSTILHPTTREKLWFNQAHLFHVSSLGTEVREDLISLVGEENVPRNAFFGDGTRIDDESLSIIRGVYEATKFSFPWQKNDLLFLDNMLFTHGREPFEGPRRILVGMAREYSHADTGTGVVPKETITYN